ANMLPFGVAIASNGSILAVDGNYLTGALNITRYTSTGVLDATFGTGGQVAKMLGGNDYYGLYSFMGIVVLPSGKIEVGLAATTTGGLTENGVLLRLDSDGTTDDMQTLAIGHGSTSINALALDADGKLVAVGRTWTQTGSSD